MRLVSVVVPDWLIATIRVSDMSRRRPEPDSSVAVLASVIRSDPANSAPTESATASPATAAVPCPMMVTRRIRPPARSARRSAPRARSPSLTVGVPLTSTSLPRRVDRTEAGASPISLIR